MQLFASTPSARDLTVPADAREIARYQADRGDTRDFFHSPVDEYLLEIYARAANPDDPFELRDLWLGRVEHRLGGHSRRADLAERWHISRVRRDVRPEEVLTSRATVRFVKELFNWFFRDDLYGELRPDADVILSGGSVDEQAWGLPDTLKECVRFALDRDWYGYSDSRGRVPAREAVAQYENVRIEKGEYSADNVALTMGGTVAVSSLSDFILHDGPAGRGPVLCAIPNYPPLVEAVARRRDVQLVPVTSERGTTSLEPLIAALRQDTPLVMLQTVGNPTGAAVAESDLVKLIEAAAPTTMIMLDECHEWLGPARQCSAARAASNVIRISSLSKNWSAPGLKLGWILADEAFISAYYEYASTSFGGPPSFFYTLIETLARLERWRVTGVESLARTHLAEFEDEYQLSLARLQAAYDSYRHERTAREDGLRVFRDFASISFAGPASSVVRPHYSINMAVRFHEWDDSYLCFRDLLRETGVAVLPGIITFCMSGGFVRVTSARQWQDLSAAVERLRPYLAVSSPVRPAVDGR